MKTLASTSPTPIEIDRDLLRSLLGRRLSASLRSLCVIGAHRYEEKGFIDWIFPNLRSIQLFEPLEQPLISLRKLESADARIKVFPFAASDVDGRCEFMVTDNDGESSSLLTFGTHLEHFPHVGVAETIQVETKRLDGLIARGEMTAPDALIIDVQGAEYKVLSSLRDSVLKTVRLIYTEVSTEPVYQGARPLSEVEQLLSPEFVNLGFAPIARHAPVHGNAVFVRREDRDAAIGYTLRGTLRNFRDAMTGVHHK